MGYGTKSVTELYEKTGFFKNDFRGKMGYPVPATNFISLQFSIILLINNYIISAAYLIHIITQL